MNKMVTWGITALALFSVSPAQADACTYQIVKLHINPNELKVTPPEPRCVLSGGEFSIEIKPPGAASRGDVTVEQKDGVPLTIVGDNTGDEDEVVVSVTGDGDPHTNYGYIIRVRGHGVLDPEIRVVSSRLMMLTSQIDAANAALEEALGFGLDELADKQAELKKLQEQAE